MNEVLDFIKNYYREIIEVVAILASIIICCIKKKPVKVVDTIKETILKVLPVLIAQAEASDKKGADKLELVLLSLQKILSGCGYGDDIIIQYLPFAREQVELILTTPQKKGN